MYLTKKAKKEIAQRLCYALDTNNKDAYQILKDRVRRLAAILDSVTLCANYDDIDKELKEIYTMAVDMYYTNKETVIEVHTA